MNGRVIGINTAIATAGQANQAVLGVRPADAPDGVAIAEVTAGSPAEQAGLKAGEVITKVNDRPVAEPVELVAAIRSYAPSESVTLTVGGRQVQVTLGSQPATGNR
jgi:putative serine protease PepD